MKAPHLMSSSERREHLETSLENARYMLKMEHEISQGRGWSAERKQAALDAIPQWGARVAEFMTPLPNHLLREYDGAAEYCASRGLKGKVGDALPANMATDGALRWINADPETFEERVRQCAYALAMETKTLAMEGAIERCDYDAANTFAAQAAYCHITFARARFTRAVGEYKQL